MWIRNMLLMLYVMSNNFKTIRVMVEREIKIITCKEEKEKLNIWIACLNLEAIYGESTQKEAFGCLFQRALLKNNTRKITLRAIAVCIRTKITELYRSCLYKRLCKLKLSS